MKFFFVFLLVIACHHEFKQDLNVDQTEQDNSTKVIDATTAGTKKQDPTDVDTKTTKSDNAVIIQELDGSATVAVVPRDKPLALKKGAKVIGTVPVSQTVVDQSRHIGGSVSTENTAETTNVNTDVRKMLGLKSDTETSTDVGFSTKFYLLAGGILLSLVALVVFSKRIRALLGIPI